MMSEAASTAAQINTNIDTNTATSSSNQPPSMPAPAASSSNAVDVELLSREKWTDQKSARLRNNNQIRSSQPGSDDNMYSSNPENPDDDSNITEKVSTAQPVDSTVIAPDDFLNPPLSPQQMESLYRLGCGDYMTHLSDSLRVRVTALLLFLVSLATCIYFAQNSAPVVIASIYLMLAAFVGVKASMREEKDAMTGYARALLLFLFLYILSFIIWLSTSGVGPSVTARCAVKSFVKTYGTNCTRTTEDLQRCTDQCHFEMRINLTIEAVGLAVVIAGFIAALCWDAFRQANQIHLWSYHPLRSQWHSQLVLFNRYADTSRVGDEGFPVAAEGDDDDDEDGIAEAADKREAEEDRIVRTAKAFAAAEAEQKSSTAASRTYGSGAVGTKPTATTSSSTSSLTHRRPTTTQES